MVNAFDSIDKDVLVVLSPEKAIELLHKLVHAELNRLKVAHKFISIPLEINIPDGGIDGTVIIDGEVKGSELIFPGKTYYQVKSGKNVKYTDSGLKNIVCVKSSGGKEKELNLKIREIVEENGALVLFLTGKSDPGVEDAEKNLVAMLKTYCPQTTVAVKIIQADNIIGILDQHLAIRLWLNRRDLGFRGKLFDEWSSEPLMSNAFKTDEKRDRIVKNIRMLAQSTDPDDKDIRVSGFPGNGKTRSVLEALRGSDVEPSVVYFDKPSDMINDGYHRGIARNDDHAVIVVDECDPQSYYQLTEAFAQTGSRVKLITIYNEPINEVRPAKYVDLNEDEVLEEKTISSIIESYDVPQQYGAQLWAPYCDGSPRMAHMIAENLSTATGDMLRNPSYASAMELFLADKGDLRSEEFKLRKKILSWFALFKRFGWSKEFKEERDFIIGIIRSKAGCSEDEILEVVDDLKRRKVLQGDKTLYIAPRLLHVRAWTWWWKAYKDRFDLNDFTSVAYDRKELSMPEQLYRWFTDMFGYAYGVEGASAVVKELLAAGGPLDNDAALTEALEGKFFVNLAAADPEGALSLIERRFKRKTDGDVRAIRQGRRNMVFCLERIAVRGSLFARAARLLLRVAATEEDHTYSNNSAEDTFAGLFGNGPGPTAPTEAPPARRYPVMKEAVTSADPGYVRMGLAAISQALQSVGFTKLRSVDMQGLLRPEPQLWSPDTWGEFFGAIRAAWDLLLSVLPSLEGDLKEEALKVIDNRISELLFNSSEPESYLEDYTRLVKNRTMPRGRAIETVHRMRWGENFSPEVAKGIGELSEYLDSGEIDALLERYVRYNSVFDWSIDDPNVAKTASKLTGMATAILDDPEILSRNAWLFTRESKNSWRFGEKLSEPDAEMELLEPLCALQKESARKDPEAASCALLAGYFGKISQEDACRWQGILYRIENDPVLVRWYAEICAATNFDDRNADTILRLIREGKLEKTELEKFRWGGQAKKISHVAFDRWIEFLLACNDVRSVNTAITLFYQHYIFEENCLIPQDLSLRLLTAETLPTGDRGSNENGTRDFYWGEIAGRYIAQYPGNTDGLAEFIIKNFSSGCGVFDMYNEYVQQVIYTLIPKNPEKIWEFVGRQLEGGMNYTLERWLSGSIPTANCKVGIKQLSPKDSVFAWIAENPSDRAPIIARIVPWDFDIEPTEGSWFKDMLNRYGEDENVQNALVDSGSASISGTISGYYAGKLEQIRRFGENNKDSEIIQTWVAKACKALQFNLDWARTSEERKDS